MNLKLSKTAIRELTRLYRGVLVAAFIASAFVGNGAKAAINVQTGTTDISGAVGTTAVEAVRQNITKNKAPDYTTYKYTAPDGSLVSLQSDGTAAIDADDYVSESAAAGYDDVTTTQSVAQGATWDKANYEFLSSALTLNGGAFTFDESGNVVVTNGTTTLSDTAPTAVSGTYTFSEYNTTYTTAQTISSDAAAPTVAINQYQKEFDSSTYTLAYGQPTPEDDPQFYLLDDSDQPVILPTHPEVLQNLVAAYQTDKDNVATAKQAADAVYQKNDNGYSHATTAATADKTEITNLTNRYGTIASTESAYATAQNNYENSLAYVVSDVADDRITNALADEGAIKTAIDTAVAYDNSTSGLTATTMQDAIDENAGAIATLNGDADTEGSVAYAVKQLADGAVADNASAIATNTTAIETLNGGADTEGSVAYAVKQLADGAVADNTSAIETLNGGADTEGSVAYAVKQLADGAVADNTSAIATNTSAIDKLNGDADTEGSVAYAVAQEASARDTAIATAITQEVSDRNTAIATATTMGDTAGNNYAANSSVIAAIESIDTNMGKIHGLIGSDGSFNGTATSTNMDGTTYKGNLAVGTTVEDHLVALDNTIGIMSNLTTTEKTTVVGAINEVDAKIGTTADGTYVAAANTVGQNLNALDSALGDVRSDMASTQASNERRFASIDHRINKLEDKMEKGLAATAALTGLSPLPPTEHKTQISAALGGYGSNQALAVGAFHYINNRTLLNAGAAYGGNSNVSYKVGVTFGF